MNTGERIMRLETQMKEHCKSNDEDLGEIKSGQTRIEVKLDSALDKKANRWVETAFWWVVSVLALSNAITIFLTLKGN